MKKIKKGDWVLCIDDSFRENQIQKGKLYKISRITNYPHAKRTIFYISDNIGLYSRRFLRAPIGEIL